MRLAPLAHPEDVRDLDEAQRRAVTSALLALAAGRGPIGKVLDPPAEHQHFAARLEGLRSLPVYTSAITVPDRYEEACRIVYRISKGTLIEVIAIGPRKGSAVYRLAAERLAPPKRRPLRPTRR